MNIQEIQNNLVYQSPQEVQEAGSQEPVADTIGVASAEKGQSKHSSYDEYTHEDEASKQTAGLYKIVHDEDGSPKIQFDHPDERFAGSAASEQIEEGSKDGAPEKSDPKSKAESCTINTDKVDREIEKLKEKKERLEQQALSSGDPEKVGELEKQLAKIENELRQKDNDAYRRQHASVS